MARSRSTLALVENGIRNGAGAPLSPLRPGRAGTVCGEIDRPNRTGSQTGPLRFVAGTSAGFAGVLPEAAG